MEIKKTGKLFIFCCVAPLIIKRKSKQEISKFENIGADIGLLFQVADDLIDNKGSLLLAGKKTGKDKIKGKATLISLLGYKNTDLLFMSIWLISSIGLLFLSSYLMQRTFLCKPSTLQIFIAQKALKEVLNGNNSKPST